MKMKKKCRGGGVSFSLKSLKSRSLARALPLVAVARSCFLLSSLVHLFILKPDRIKKERGIVCYNNKKWAKEKNQNSVKRRASSQDLKRASSGGLSLFLTLSLFLPIARARAPLPLPCSQSPPPYLFPSPSSAARGENPRAPERSRSGRPRRTRSLAAASSASSGETSARTANGWSSGRSVARASRSGGEASLRGSFVFFFLKGKECDFGEKDFFCCEREKEKGGE